MPDTPSASPYSPKFRDWLEPYFTRNAHGPGPTVSVAEGAASEVAIKLATGSSSAAVVCEPGDGSRYAVVFTQVTDPPALAYAGDLLVSLPDYNACLLLNVLGDGGGFIVPNYVGEKIGGQLGAGGCAFVAVLATEVANRYGALRAAEPYEVP